MYSVLASLHATDRLASSSLRVAMIGENRELVIDEPVEVQDCRKITDCFRESYRIYSNFRNENRRMSTCNRLDLQTLGSQLVMPKDLPDQSLVGREGHS